MLHGLDLLLASDERGRLDGQVVVRGVERLKRRKSCRQAGHDQLKEVTGVLQVLEAMGSQILQAHSIWQITLHQVAGRLREQHLPSVTSAHDPCRMMHIQADIPLGGPLGLTGMQPHTHAHRHPTRKSVGSESALGIHRGFDGIGGASEGHEESIALGVHLVAVPLLNCCPHQAPVVCQHRLVASAQLLKQAR